MIEGYSERELAEAASWPAVRRALGILERAPIDESSGLRLARHRAWVDAALAIRFERATPEAVCRAWSDAADAIVREAWIVAGAPCAVFALGKLGARELNLSSDIDLIYARDDGGDPPLRELREFQRLLGEQTEFGFCFRVDVTIRPGGAAAPLAPTLSQFENHYGYHGEMWERLALIRLRAIAGPAGLVSQIEEFARKFSYRRHLDYTVLDDLNALRSRIRAERPDRGLNEFHLKLGRGGIRELELFTHALQAMRGGRDPTLRTGSTSEALAALSRAGALPDADARKLADSYWRMRDVENRVQAYEDQQTYWIDLEKGSPAAPRFDADELRAMTSEVAKIADSLMGADSGSVEVDSPRLEELGFSRSSIDEAWPKLLEATALSRRSSRDERERRRFLEAFVEALAAKGLDKDLGLALLVDFAKATRAKATFFSLLNREPRLLEDLARLLSTSPYLGGLLCARPELIDGFFLRATESALPADWEELLDELAERRLLSELVAAQRFLSTREIAPLQRNLTESADAICAALLERLASERERDEGLGIVALGKWGGRELGFKSDLDFLFVSSQEPGEESQRIAKRFLSRLAQPRKGGSIYAVDMRLRPSGASGPLMVSWPKLREYVATKAAAWERQAYLRATPLAPAPFSLAAAAAERGLSADDRAELKSIRAQLFVESRDDEIDLKLARGGLASVEFAAQIALLDEGRASLDPSTRGMIQCVMQDRSDWRDAGDELARLHESLRAVEQMRQLTENQPGSKLRPKSESFRRLARAIGRAPAELEADVRGLMARAAELIAELDALARS